MKELSEKDASEKVRIPHMRIIIAIIIALIFFMVASPFSRINFVRIISPIFPSVNSRIAKNDGKKRCKIGISNGICVINTAAGGGIGCQTKRKGIRSQSGAALGFRFAVILYADKKGPERESAPDLDRWSRQRESNPPPRLGKPLFYR